MKVLVLLNYFDRDGGTSKVLTEAKYLARLGVRLIVAVPCNPFAKADVAAKLRRLGVTFYRAPTHYRLLYWLFPFALWRLSRIIRREKVGLLHVHHGRALLLGAALGRLHRVPLVYTIHGVSRRELPPAGRSFLFRGVSRVIAVSEECAAHFLARVRYRPERVLIGRNAIDLSHFRPAAESPPVPGRLVCISRLDPDKQRAVEAVMEGTALAFRERPRLRLVIIGDGRLRRRVLRRARAINARLGAEVVSFAGWADDPAGHYAGAEAVLGVGRCVLEALAMGRPALVVGSETIGGWVTPDRFRSLQEANFSGRNAAVPTSGQAVARELSRLPGIAAAATRAASRVRRDHEAGGLALQVREIYRQAMDEARPGAAAKFPSPAPAGIGACSAPPE